MKSVSILLLCFAFSSSVIAQNQSVTFPASELQDMALRYAGSSLNWPVLVSLADHDIPSNTFTLSNSDMLQLETLAEITASVNSEDQRVKSLIAIGAPIFTKEQLNEVNSMFKSYLNAIQQGNIEQALNMGRKIPGMVDDLDDTLQKNRVVEAQAQLTKKKGEVDKRDGLLASWYEATEGDLFKEADGIRTKESSYAHLLFTDGSNVLIDPSSTAIIRKSRIDRLDETSDTEISLVEGGLLAKLSNSAKNRSRYIVNAGDSRSELRSQNFYAESDGQREVKLTNYDGQVDVSASNITISIRKNEGTIVRDGEPPAPPIILLPAPELAWNTKDTVIYTSNIVFPFKNVDEATQYLVQYSTSPSFDQGITEIKTPSNSVQLSNLPVAKIYARVLAIDKLGLRGPFSETARITQNEDNKPPPIFLYGVSENINFTLNNNLNIIGYSEPEVNLIINGNKVDVNTSGRFNTFVNLEGNDSDVVIKAIDNSGNESVKTVRVVQLTEEVLFDLSLNGAAQSGNIIRKGQNLVTISNIAYPSLDVILNNNGSEKIIQTDNSGRWGITMKMQEGNLSITFRDRKTGSEYLTNSYTVQAN